MYAFACCINVRFLVTILAQLRRNIRFESSNKAGREFSLDFKTAVLFDHLYKYIYLFIYLIFAIHKHTGKWDYGCTNIWLLL